MAFVPQGGYGAGQPPSPQSSTSEESEVFSPLFQLFDSTLNELVITKVSMIGDALNEVVYSILTLYVIWTAISIVTGRTSVSTTDKVKELAIVVFCVSLAINAALYNQFFYDFFTTESGKGLANWIVFLVSEEHDIGALLDEITSTGLKAITDHKEDTAWYGKIGAGIIAGIYFVFLVLFSVSVLMVAFIAKFTLALGVILGPIFIFLAAFYLTRQFFMQWLQYMLDGSLVIGLLALVIVVLHKMQVTENMEFKDFVSLFKPVVVLTAFGILARNIPAFSSALVGSGMSLSDGGATSRTMGILPNATRSVRDTAAKRATRGISERREAARRDRISSHMDRYRGRRQQIASGNTGDSKNMITSPKAEKPRRQVTRHPVV